MTSTLITRSFSIGNPFTISDNNPLEEAQRIYRKQHQEQENENIVYEVTKYFLQKKFKHDKFIICNEYIYYYFYDMIYIYSKNPEYLLKSGKININGSILKLIKTRICRLYEIYRCIKNKIYSILFHDKNYTKYVAYNDNIIDYDEVNRLMKYAIDTINTICELHRPTEITYEMIESIIMDYFE
jgi:hypothetical protein